MHCTHHISCRHRKAIQQRPMQVKCPQCIVPVLEAPALAQKQCMHDIV